MLKHALTALFLLATPSLAACASAGGSSAPAAVIAEDPHSYAKPKEARVTHVALDLTTDFTQRRLEGTATLDVVAAKGARHVVLDVKDLDIRAVTDTSGAPLAWRLGAADPILGQALTIDLPTGAPKVVVRYATTSKATALQWLTPEQTAGKKQPYLFSQGQAILTRTWVPTQDSPGIRQTYEARIVAPDGMRAVMSAEALSPEGEPARGGRAYRFALKNAVPPYLIALAVGDLQFRSVGPRSGVWAEPSVVDSAASEFADIEKMIDAAEKLYGPYRWGRYDVLVLPPSFPFGGMENPRLTFATPTVLAGDRSLVSLIAHELAHSWSGNLVTNAVWADFWLNEGVTTYIENRIMEELYGPDRAAMLRTLGWQDLQEAIEGAGGPAASGTRLHLNLTGSDPDDGMTQVAYEKGAAFLRTIEAQVGRERFDTWLRGYFDRHAFQPITSERFLEDLRRHLVRGDKALEAALQLNTWVYDPGVPSNATPPTSAAFAAVESAAQRFVAGGAPADLSTSAWTTQEWQHFLGALPEKLTTGQLKALDEAFGLSKTGNSEIRFAWLRIAVRNRYEPALPSLEQFLTSQGRRKFIRPLFDDLMKQGDWGQPIARRLYAAARPGYHPVTQGSVDVIVK